MCVCVCMYVKHKVRHDLATEQQQVYKYDWFILTLYPATLVNSLINSKNFFLNCCSVTKSCLTLCDLMDYCVPGFLILHCLPEFAQTHIHWISDAIQPSHSLSPPSSPALSLSQHEGVFQWVGSSHQVSKVLELQLQHQPFQWIFMVDFL